MIWLYISITLMLFSTLTFFYTYKTNFSIGALLAGVFFMGMYMIQLDPFLNTWDESFHALVAKNTASHFLKPTLIEKPLLTITEYAWYHTTVWLHKQPLFLWQMALSIKLFGTTLFAVRLPSVILLVLLTLVVFDTGRILFSNEVGFMAACFIGVYEPLLEIVSGCRMDNNNVSFIFYISASIWVWLKYEKTKQVKYILLMGLFAGCAVLNKWLTGLLVFLGLGGYHLFFEKNLFSTSTMRVLLYGIGVCLLVVLPWQIYILTHYPAEAHLEYQYNARHFTEALEGHQHELWFYINIMKEQYKYLHLLFVPMIILTIYRSKKEPLPFVLMCMAIFVYLFFTIAKTKLAEYVLIVAPILLLLLSHFIYNLLLLIQNRKTRTTLLIFCTIIICYILFDFRTINENHGDSIQWIANYRNEKKELMQKIYIIQHRYNTEKFVIVNTEKNNHLDIMYFCDCHSLNHASETDIIALQKQGFNVIEYRDIKI